MARDLDTPDAEGITLRERLEPLRGWCTNRIQQCRREEANLGVRADGTYRAATERIALTAVMKQLGWPVPPRDEADLRGRGTAAAAVPWPKPRGAHAHKGGEGDG